MVQFLSNLYREQYICPVSCSLYREQNTWSSFYVAYTGSTTHGPVSMQLIQG